MRGEALQNVDIGDLFHAEASNGASLICRTLDVDAEFIYAKTVTTHSNFVFSRKDGTSQFNKGNVVGVIDSVAPLPEAIDAAIRGLEHKFRPGADPEGMRLTDAEKKALVFIDGYYKDNQI